MMKRKSSFLIFVFLLIFLRKFKNGPFKLALDKNLKPTIPFLLVENLEATFDYLCEIFYPNKPKFVMGVTGTNGKTSVVNFSQQLIEKKNK